MKSDKLCFSCNISNQDLRMDLLDSMKVYVLTVDKGSLSAAADACGMSATMAGNHVRALEQRLGMQLMHRTTRRQHVTAFGESITRAARRSCGSWPRRTPRRTRCGSRPRARCA